MKIEKDVLGWLLEENQPAVRLRAMVDLLDLPPNDPAVRAAAGSISRLGWAHDILRLQKPGGYWDSRKDFYRPKYTATIWRLIVLSDLGLTREEACIRQPCELFLNEYSRPDGGFDSPESTWSRSEHCLTGNLARTLVLCGYGGDRRVRSAFDWLVENQMKDGGWHCFYERAFGRGTLDCWEGLSAFAALPRSRWTRKIKNSVERGAEFYLERGLMNQGKRYAPWLRFHYPVHYYYDVLVGLDVLTALGYGEDRRLGVAVELLKGKRRPDGTWLLDAVHPDIGRGAGYTLRRKPRRFALEREGKPSKWITMLALRALKRAEA